MSGRVNRRAFVLGGIGAVAGAAAGCGERRRSPAPGPHARLYDAVEGAPTTPVTADALPDGLSADDFTVYTRTPLTLESLRSSVGSELITPTRSLFVRNNLPLPSMRIVNAPDDWRLHVWGVREPRSFTLRELRELGAETVVSVLQCSGNGRRFFEHDPSGSPWGVGAAGCVQWTGVRCSSVIAAAGGPLPEASFLNAAGGDPIPTLPKGIGEDMIRIERSIPIAKGLDDALLAWDLGGAPLPLTHGGPLRLVVPGYYGVNNVKYVQTLTCSPTQSTARIQRSSYRVRPIGTRGDPAQPTMWRMVVKSWIGGPGSDGEPVLAGRVRIFGVAFSGERGVRSVDVSVDGGRSWSPAAFDGPDHGPNAWRRFIHETTLPPGEHVLCSRAADTAGDVQPPNRSENARGYGNNSWLDHALAIEVFETMPERPPARERQADEAVRPAELSAEAKRGRDVFLRRADPQCGNCHALADAEAGMAIGPNLDQLNVPIERVQNAVENGVGIMQPYRDKLTAAEILDIARYVVEARRGQF